MDFLKLCNRTTVEITHVDNRRQKNKKTLKEMFLRKRGHQIFLNLHAISKTFLLRFAMSCVLSFETLLLYFSFADSQALIFVFIFFMFISSAICFVCNFYGFGLVIH